jgi:hypothetical protein
MMTDIMTTKTRSLYWGKKFYRTDFLFPRHSFIVGAGSILSIFDAYLDFNYSKTSAEADRKALESDFGTIGKDIFIAIHKTKDARSNSKKERVNR